MQSHAKSNSQPSSVEKSFFLTMRFIRYFQGDKTVKLNEFFYLLQVSPDGNQALDLFKIKPEIEVNGCEGYPSPLQICREKGLNDWMAFLIRAGAHAAEEKNDNAQNTKMRDHPIFKKVKISSAEKIETIPEEKEKPKLF